MRVRLCLCHRRSIGDAERGEDKFGPDIFWRLCLWGILREGCGIVGRLACNVSEAEISPASVGT
jgi:hypothetical protein